MNGLEALKSIRPCANVCGDYDPYCDTIEKELKALEIIKNKKVNVPLLIQEGSVYNCYVGYEVLTQDELDLLKEVLK